MKEKVILAYSGGLDTTAIIPWLKENYDYDVICCCIDCGQEEELDGLEERAKLSGASKLYIEDITDEFAEEYIIPCVQAGAVYENKYLLGTSMARPGIAKRLVEIARKEGATAICHGATGKGNDQIRFELGILFDAPVHGKDSDFFLLLIIYGHGFHISHILMIFAVMFRGADDTAQRRAPAIPGSMEEWVVNGLFPRAAVRFCHNRGDYIDQLRQACHFQPVGML